MNNCDCQIVHGYRNKPFPVELLFYDKDRNEIDATTVSFKYIFIDETNINRYVVERDVAAGTYINCYVDEGKLYAKFENQNFNAGVLSCEYHKKIEVTPDAGEGFSGGYWEYIETTKTNIVIE